MKPANPFAPRTYGDLEAVAPGVFIWRNIVNSAVFVGSNAIAVVDTQVNTAAARRLLTHLQSTFTQPIRYAINTHYHWDHCAGNATFHAAGATLIAGRRTAAALVERMPRQRAFLASRGFELGDDPLRPDVLAEDQPCLDLGGLSLELRPALAAESPDPTLVWCPERRLMASGDTVMTGSFPIFGQPSQREGMENTGWLDALAEIRGFAPDAVLPGHGPLARAPELDLLARIMRYFLEQTALHHAAGRSLDETIALMEDEMPAWITRIPEVWGTPRYAILRAWCGLVDLGQPGFQHVKPSAIPRRTPAPTPTHDERVAWLALIQQLTEGGDTAGAMAAAEAAAAAHDESWAHVEIARVAIAASRGIASVLEKGDCFQLARAAVARALERDPDYGPAHLQDGQFLVMMAFRNGEDPARGEAPLERAAADPRLTARERAELAFYRGIAQRARGDEAAARRHFGVALVADPTFMPARLACG